MKEVYLKLPNLGLANRLRILVSAIIFAADRRAKLFVDWRPSASLGASLNDLFREQAWDQGESNASVLLKTNGIRLDFEEEDSVMLEPKGQFATRDLDCREYFERKRKVYSELVATTTVQPKLKKLRTFLKEKMVFGLHIRVFDEKYDWPVVPPQNSSSTAVRWDDVAPAKLHVDAAKQLLTRHPRAYVFVCSNDLATAETVVNALKPRAFSIHHVHNRNSLDGVLAGLLDFLVLAESTLILHTFGSSFGEEAAAVRGVPSIRIRSQGHLLGVDLNRPFCHHPLFENSDSSSSSLREACFTDPSHGREICARPMVRAPCNAVLQAWGVRDVYC